MPSPRSPSPEADEPADALAMEFGARVRALREQARLTLEALSDRSGVSRAMLSKVERGEKSPTIGVAKRIASALGATLSDLMGGNDKRQAMALVRRTQRLVFRDGETGFERHLLSPSMAGAVVEILQHYLPAGVTTGMLPAMPSGVDKHVIALEGRVTVVLPSGRLELADGDTLFFEADVEHAFENASREPCTYYLVISRRPPHA